MASIMLNDKLYETTIPHIILYDMLRSGRRCRPAGPLSRGFAQRRTVIVRRSLLSLLVSLLLLLLLLLLLF